MSIIDDALKKAGEERDKNKKDNKDIQPGETPKAGLPTGQAGLPTDQAGLPTDQAGLPTDQAGLPTDQAGLPTDQVGLPKTEDIKLEPPKEIRQKIDIAGLKEKLNQRPALFIIGGVIVLAILLFSITLVKRLSPKSVSAPPAPAAIPIQQDSLPPVEIEQAEAPRRLPAAKKEDFIPEKLEIIDTSEFQLSGIVHGEGAPVAIINGGVYLVGDNIKSARIVEILQDRVILEKNGDKLEIKLQ